MATEPQQIEADSIEQQFLALVRNLLIELGKTKAAEHVTLASSFERDLGVGSLDLVELMVRTEAHFDLKLPDEIAEQAETLAAWVQAIESGGQAADESGAYRVVRQVEPAPPAPETARNLVDVLLTHARSVPERVHIHLLEEGAGQDITYGQLLRGASLVAAGLTASGLRRNDTVAILLPAGADFFYAFLGVTLAGGIPVPVYPPTRPDEIEQYVRRQARILRSANISFLIAFERVRPIAQILRLELGSQVSVVSVEELRRAAGPQPIEGFEPSDIAVIQYTSGSTGDPKGVVLTHANLLANIRGIGAAVDVHPSDAVVSWLPLYSDMGLVGSWLFSFYYGVPLTLLSPLEFLERPETWLWAVHDSRATLSAAPNFAYELCAAKIPAWTLEGLDLSHWRCAVVAGETVLPGTLQRFYDRFHAFGFRSEALTPCYGLAENSVALTFSRPDSQPYCDVIRREPFETSGSAEPAGDGESDVLEFFALGRPLDGHEIRILDEQGNDVGERIQGRIVFRGPSRTSGYYRNPEATAAVLTPDGFMDTGDRGYIAGGQLFLTGRQKDCIIKAGRSLSPHDIEVAANTVPGVHGASAVAFGIPDPDTGTEQMVVVAESKAFRKVDLARVEAGVRRAVEAAVGMAPDIVEIVRVGRVPRTSNGKLRRTEARDLYEAGKLRAGSRPTWMQLARLWLQNIGPWFIHTALRATAWFDRLMVRLAESVIGRTAGLLVRTVGPSTRSRIAAAAARRLLSLGGESGRLQGAAVGRPAVYLANQTARRDPLALLALLDTPVCFVDPAAWHGLPPAIRYFLNALVLPALKAHSMPPGGTIHERTRAALDRGLSVAFFPENLVGAPARLSRFRLDAFSAASLSGAPLVPVAVRRKWKLRIPGTAAAADSEVIVTIGTAIDPAREADAGATTLRERVRGAIAQLCR